MLHRLAAHAGQRKCWTCPRPLKSESGTMDHTWRGGHGRAGMIPRWKEDNAWFHRRDVTRAVKSYDKFGKSSHFCGLCHLKCITVSCRPLLLVPRSWKLQELIPVRFASTNSSIPPFGHLNQSSLGGFSVRLRLLISRRPSG
jgi:hypothetical protein